MTIIHCKGNLLESNADALVNAVNTVGVMGKGIALAFKHRYPECYREYVVACKKGEVTVGKIFVTATATATTTDLLNANSRIGEPKYIVNFPTKKHWKHPSQISWIVKGIHSLREWIIENDIKTIAIPALGVGNGGLKWNDIRSNIEIILGDLETTDIYLFSPLEDQINCLNKFHRTLL
jgi:O-acetyl-ADP-ribose deacetylase (regulator of RNase III)